MQQSALILPGRDGSGGQGTAALIPPAASCPERAGLAALLRIVVLWRDARRHSPCLRRASSEGHWHGREAGDVFPTWGRLLCLQGGTPIHTELGGCGVCPGWGCCQLCQALKWAQASLAHPGGHRRKGLGAAGGGGSPTSASPQSPDVPAVPRRGAARSPAAAGGGEGRFAQ